MREGERRCAAGQLVPGDHVCWQFGSDEAYAEMLAGSVATGMARGERVLSLSGGVSLEWLRAAVADRGLPVETLVASGQLVLGDARTALGRHGLVRRPGGGGGLSSRGGTGGGGRLHHLTLDMGGLDFIEVQGLRGLVATADQPAGRGARLRLRSPSPTMQRCLTLLDPPEHLQRSS